MTDGNQALMDEKLHGWRGPMLIHLGKRGGMKNFLDRRNQC
jgi:hypothetical protein